MRDEEDHMSHAPRLRSHDVTYTRSTVNDGSIVR
jgi:hypothetical protein